MHRLFVFVFLILGTFLYGQTQPVKPTVSAPTSPVLSPGDSVFVLVENEQKYLLHTFLQGQTLYGIAKFYSVELADLYYCNPTLSEKGSKPGQVLKIPVSGRALRRPKDQPDSLWVKVFYRVKTGETLYRIANVYFKIPIEILQKMNGMKTDRYDLRVDQALHVGWLNRYGIPDSLRRHNGLTGVLLEKNTEYRNKYEEVKTAGKKEHAAEGAACWIKGERYSDAANFSVLFNGLPAGAIMRLENPMTGRVIYAKVIGPLPDNSYVDNALLVVSPTIAYALGAIDARFFVKLHYLK